MFSSFSLTNLKQTVVHHISLRRHHAQKTAKIRKGE